MASRFDLVLDAAGSSEQAWSTGVQFAEYHFIDIDPARAGRPVFIAELDRVRTSRSRASLLDVLATAVGTGAEIFVDAHSVSAIGSIPPAVRVGIGGSVDLARLGPLFRSRAVVLVDSTADLTGIDMAHAAAICGARVVSVAGLRSRSSAHGPVDPSSRDLVAAIGSATAATPLDEGSIRAAARDVFVHHAVPVRLASLTKRLGLSLDPLADRSVAVLVDLRDGDGGGVEAIARQRHRPTEVIAAVATNAPPSRALEILRTHGVAVRTVPSETEEGSWPRLAAEATSMYVVPWPASLIAGPDHLLDLAIGREASRADMIGFADVPNTRFVDDLPVAGSLVRRDVLTVPPIDSSRSLADGPARWARRGLRLLAMPRARTESPA